MARKQDVKEFTGTTGDKHTLSTTFKYEREEDGCGNSRNERYLSIEYKFHTPLSDEEMVAARSEIEMNICSDEEHCTNIQVNKVNDSNLLTTYKIYQYIPSLTGEHVILR